MALDFSSNTLSNTYLSTETDEPKEQPTTKTKFSTEWVLRLPGCSSIPAQIWVAITWKCCGQLEKGGEGETARTLGWGMGKREKECVPYGLAKITENPRNWAKSQKTCHYFVIHSRNIWGFRFVKKKRICLEDKLPCICGRLSLLVCEPFVLSFFFWHTQPGSISSTDKFQT